MYCNLRKSGGVMLAIVGSHCTSVVLTVRVMICMIRLSAVSTLYQYALLDQTGAQYSVTLYTRVIADIRKILALLPQFESASLEMMLIIDLSLFLTHSRSFFKIQRPVNRLTPRYFGLFSLAMRLSSIFICSFICASCLW